VFSVGTMHAYTLDENMDFMHVGNVYRIGQNFLHISFIFENSALSSTKHV
jgi:hypothetical protein